MAVERITIDALIAAGPERVWTCWTEPAHITQWNFATDDWCCPSAQNDLRPGGRYVARMEARHGGFGFDLELTHEAVAPQRRLVSVMPNGRRVETTFASEAGGVRVTTVFDPESEHPIAMQRDGWQAILNNFKRYVETL